LYTIILNLPQQHHLISPATQAEFTFQKEIDLDGFIGFINIKVSSYLK
jgi:hypothetical protein